LTIIQPSHTDRLQNKEENVMTKLNQIVAIELPIKTRVNAKLSEIYKTLARADLFTGHAKKYAPGNADSATPAGEMQPEDKRHVQQHAKALLSKIAETATELYDISYLRDLSNCSAKADVVVDGKAVLKDVPVTYLLWLEKQLRDLHAEITRLPSLDPAEKWTWVPEQSLFASEKVETARTKKTFVALVLAPATDKHPAQVKEGSEDVRMGTWTTVKYSSAIPADRREVMLKRVEDLQKAVKQAREQANSMEVPVVDSLGKKIFDFVLAE
jgi:hypothetical protein